MKFYLTENGLKTRTEYGELHISSDKQHGFRPYQLMISSIVGCSTAIFYNILKKQRLAVSEISVSTTIKRIKEEANRIAEISIVYHIKGKNLQQQKINRALELARKHCGMIQSVQGSIMIKEDFELINED